MSRAITWKSLSGDSSVGNPVLALEAARQGLNAGFSGLAKTATDYREGVFDQNTNNFEDALAQRFKTPEEVHAAMKSGAIEQLRAQYGGNAMDRDVARSAAPDLLTTLQTRTKAEQTYADQQLQREMTPVVNAALIKSMQGQTLTPEEQAAIGKLSTAPEILGKANTLLDSAVARQDKLASREALPELNAIYSDVYSGKEVTPDRLAKFQNLPNFSEIMKNVDTLRQQGIQQRTTQTAQTNADFLKGAVSGALDLAKLVTDVKNPNAPSVEEGDSALKFLMGEVASRIGPEAAAQVEKAYVDAATTQTNAVGITGQNTGLNREKDLERLQYAKENWYATPGSLEARRNQDAARDWVQSVVKDPKEVADILNVIGTMNQKGYALTDAKGDPVNDSKGNPLVIGVPLTVLKDVVLASKDDWSLDTPSSWFWANTRGEDFKAKLDNAMKSPEVIKQIQDAEKLQMSVSKANTDSIKEKLNKAREGK